MRPGAFLLVIYPRGTVGGELRLTMATRLQSEREQYGGVKMSLLRLVGQICVCASLVAGCGGGGGGGTSGSTAPAPSTAITAQPADQQVEVGLGATFGVTASNAIGYRWQQSIDGVTWADTGASGSSLSIISTDLAMNGTKYRVIVSGANNDVTSTAATLTVSVVPPSIVLAPSAQSVSVGQQASFSVNARGTSITIRWQVSSNTVTWSDVPGANSGVLLLDGLTQADSGKSYRVVVSNPAGEVASPAALLTVTAAPWAPTFVTQPVDTTVVTGQSARFSAAPLATNPRATAQWQVSADGVAWSDVAGANRTTLTTGPTTSSDNGKRFRMVSGNAAGFVNSMTATLTVVGSSQRNLTVLAGQPGGAGNADAAGSMARFSFPQGIAVDSTGNAYVTSGCALRKITSSALVSTLAGQSGWCASVDGSGNTSGFVAPSGVAVDAAGVVYVADNGANTMRKITADGTVTTFAGVASQGGSTDGAGSVARFNGPTGLAIDAAGNLYVADSGNHTVRKITAGGLVTTLAGLAGNSGSVDGSAAVARFNIPQAVAVDSSGNLFVADAGNHTVRKIAPDGTVSTLAGLAGSSGSNEGTGSAARFNVPIGVAVDSSHAIYVSDSGNQTVRKVTPDGVVTTVAGLAGNAGSTDASGSAARFYYPSGIALDASGTLYVSDSWNHALRKVVPGGLVSTWAGLPEHAGTADGSGSSARFHLACDLTVDALGNLYVADAANNLIRKVTPAGVVSSYFMGSDTFNLPMGVAIDAAGNIFVADQRVHVVRKITQSGVVSIYAGSPGMAGSADGDPSTARLSSPRSLAVDSSGNVYVSENGNHTIRKITPAGVVSTLAGLAGAAGGDDGTGSAARFNSPGGMVLDAVGNLYVVDDGVVRKVTPAGAVTTLAGVFGSAGSVDGIGSAARFHGLEGLTIDTDGNLYAADRFNHTIRKITPGGNVTTLVGTSGIGTIVLGSTPFLNNPTGVAMLDSKHLAITSENTVLVYTLP